MNGENTPMIIETGGGSNNGGLFGMGDGGYVILFLLILFGLFGGNFGGGFGGNRCGGSDGISTVLPLVMGGYGGGHSCGSSVAEQFAINNLQSGIDAIRQGQCTGTYDIVGAIKDCCCQTQGAVKDVRFDISSGLCSLGNSIQLLGRDLLENQNNGTRAILDYLSTAETQRLRDEVQTLRLAASQSNQNAVLMAAMDANKAEILRRSGYECPTAAYIVQPPTPVNFTNNGCGYTGNGYGGCGNGCGCGCGW